MGPLTNSNKQQAIEIAITLALLALIIGWSLRILSPFISVTLWGGIIAIAMHRPFSWLKMRFGGRTSLAVTAFILLGAVIVVAPLWMFTSSMLGSAQELRASAEAGTLAVPQPRESVREWPVVGERLYVAWSAASDNVSEFIADHQDQVRAMVQTAGSKIAGLALGALQFLVSILIAAGFLASANTVAAGMSRLFRRLAGARGDGLQGLTVATVRSVAGGVLGIAAVQAVLAGLGMVLVEVPGAGLWTLLVLVVAIAQLPPWLVMLPVIFYVFSVESTTIASVFAVWSMLVSFADMALKPLVLGRGVDAPMPVILLGAIGGMITAGIVGLFVGAVVLAIGYRLLLAWLELGEAQPVATARD